MVLFIHGFLEGPSQFETLASLAVEAGWDARALLLPGHGGTGKAFAKSHRMIWWQAVDFEIKRLSRQYQQILLVGHSMGALFSLLSCEEYASVCGVVAIATPIHLHLKRRGIQSAFKSVTGYFDSKDLYTKASYEAFSISTKNPITCFNWAPRYLELFKLIRVTKERVSQIQKPISLIQCEQDEFVKASSLSWLEAHLSSESLQTLTLSNSGHFYYDETDQVLLNRHFEAVLVQFSGRPQH